ncbi:MAG: hypothetical protein CMI26_08670 [Opitutae bacterium]|nr:hypothetical protein [Opitutae bacterium]
MTNSASNADKDLWCSSGDKMAHLKHAHIVQELKRIPVVEPGPCVVVWDQRVFLAFLTEVVPETLAVYVMENVTHVDESMSPIHIFKSKTSTAADVTAGNQWAILKILSGKQQNFQIKSSAKVQMALTPERDGLVILVDGISSSSARHQVLHSILSKGGQWLTSVNDAEHAVPGGELTTMDLTRVHGTSGGTGETSRPSLLKLTLSVHKADNVVDNFLTLERFTNQASIGSRAIDYNHTKATLQLPAGVLSVSKANVVPPEATLAATLPSTASYVLCHVFVMVMVYREGKSHAFKSIMRLDVTSQENNIHSLSITIGSAWARGDAFTPTSSVLETLASAASVDTAAMAAESTLFVATSSHITFDTLHVTTSDANKLSLVRLDEHGRVRKNSNCASILTHPGLIPQVSSMVALGRGDAIKSNHTVKATRIRAVARNAILAYTRYFDDRLSLHVAILRVG